MNWKLVPVVLIAAVFCAGCLSTAFTTAKGWNFSAEDMKASSRTARVDLKNLFEVECKITKKEFDRLQLQLDEADASIKAAEDAWTSWQLGGGVEQAVKGMINNAQELSDRAQNVVDSWKIRVNRVCGDDGR